MGKYTDWASAYKASVDILAESATDATASKVPGLYAGFYYDGSLIKSGTRRLWTDGCLYAAQYDTYDREDTDPAHDTNGWAALHYHSGYRDIPDAMTTATMYKAGEVGWRADKFWQSKIDNNSWTPEDYPDGWEEITI